MQRLSLLFVTLKQMPTTNTRIFVSLILATGYVLLLLLALVLNLPVNKDAMGAAGMFLAAMMGLDVAQYHSKRITFQPDPPSAPDAEDGGAAGAVVSNTVSTPLATHPAD